MKDGKKQGQVQLQLPSSASADNLKFKILKVKRKAGDSDELTQKLQVLLGEEEHKAEKEEQI